MVQKYLKFTAHFFAQLTEDAVIFLLEAECSSQHVTLKTYMLYWILKYYIEGWSDQSSAHFPFSEQYSNDSNEQK